MSLIYRCLRKMGFWVFVKIASVLKSVEGVLIPLLTISLARLSLKLLLKQVHELVLGHLEVCLLLGVVAGSISLREVVLKELLALLLAGQEKDLLVLRA